MAKNIVPKTNQDFEKLLYYIQQKQIHVFQKINTALIDLYWELGKTLSEKVKNNEWGKSVVTEFAKYITSNAPDIRGFSDKNLWRMKQFYETYVDHPELSALLRELEPSTKQVFRNSYVLEFLGLKEEHTESDLQKES